MTVYDFCNLCTDDEATISIYNNETGHFGMIDRTVHEVMFENPKYCDYTVESFDLNDDGLTLNVVRGR